ncbi:uncharacterized protein LOC120841849 [Ixodes scapularis]|uniref:uncharacterized protein LOC120841849 n=1 Tax=Ixodes scapularis TaxID=6945 RepID=UPI001A9D51A7|nr:uncharacterized protein LOC120841849 [Ixodes scapularis]
MAGSMFFLVVCAGLCLATPCLATVQTPPLTSCSSTHILLVNVLTLTNAKLGQAMLFNYTGQLSASLTSSPVFNFTMTKQSDGSLIPCILNLGSCVYKMCGGNTTIEQEIGEPWNNVCPFASLNYSSNVGIKIPSIARLIIEDRNLHLQIVALDGGSVVGCKEFDFNIALS